MKKNRFNTKRNSQLRNEIEEFKATVEILSNKSLREKIEKSISEYNQNKLLSIKEFINA